VRRWPTLASALLIATGGIAGGLESTALAATPPKASPHVVAGHATFKSGSKQVVRLDPTYLATQPHAQSRLAQPNVLTPTAKINVTYIGFSPAAKAAFQAAVDIWQTQIHSAVPIDVVADWSNLTAMYGDDSILGAAGPTTFVKNFDNAPVQNVYYPAALANAIAGSDQLPPNVCNSDPSFPDASGAEITASFNSAQADWYYGVNGTPGPGQVDLESVVLHELGHGLGFVGTYDGLDPNTGNDLGRGYFGLSGDGLNPTIFDTFATDSSGTPLSTYGSNTTGLGNILRGGANGARWAGTAGMAANGGTRPLLFSSNPWQPGSGFSHLDEATYPANSGNALMSPALHFGEIEHSVGPIVLGMFQDMGWPTSGAPAATTIGDYHVAAPARLVSQHVTTNSAPLHVLVAGQDGLPSSGIKAVTVNIAVQSPTKNGIWSTLANCGGSGSWPDSQNFLAKQNRTMQTTLPVDDAGNIEVSLTASPASAISGLVSVDLVGWYGNPTSGAVSFHPLAQKQVFSGTLTSTPVDVKVLGVAGIPASGVTAVALSAGEGFGITPGFLLVGPGGINSIVPTVGYSYAELTQNLVTVPVGTGAGAGKVRVRVSTGRANAVLNVLGWYGPATSGGLNFHSAGPARVTAAPRGADVTIGGLPNSTPVVLNVHVGSPTATSVLSAAPGGSTALTTVQEIRPGQNTSGRVIVTTNASGQVRLHVSAGVATFYTDFEGWFSAS
jgi:hypothetical protein